MDGSVADHSDSDSGESWTLLEPSSPYAEESPELCDNFASHERDTPELNAEKDEDTDGISIISDSEPESSSPYEISLEKYHEESRPTEQHTPHYISVTPLPTNNIEQHESIRNEDDFLTDNNGKNKTYVHRRNKRLSTVLNIIMLGSVITAAGVAIGHMWGARNDCSMHTTPSVNKILSNLYKLQEENAYLRSKLKELSLISNTQLHRKSGTEKVTQKPQRCKKVYEEPLNSKITEKITKCLDNNAENILQNHFIQQEYEKEFLNDIDKLKNVYKQNKNWLDEEINKRMKHEEQLIKNKSVLQSTQLKTVQEEQPETQNDNSMIQNDIHNPVVENKPLETDDSQFVIITNVDKDEDMNKISEEKKISYADSLKTEQLKPQFQKIQIPDINKFHANIFKERMTSKNNRKGDGFDALEISLSDFKFIKDDRYIGPKNKQERKKYDRQKLHKKQKRKNKYEQWEMKGGYMKDYDDISTASSQDNEHARNTNIVNNYEPDIVINQLPEIDKTTVLGGNEHKAKRDKYFRNVDKKNKEKASNKNKELNWYEKRAALRSEARQKLEQEMFGESTPNNAGWYFRRMQKREQCRAKGDNTTYRKFSKRHMNYKIKH
ncbi:uncharacterized protein LOC115442721 [Manduca sexta]|uniref:uncharacterized protein LOC115442721 n=1 Tax=Manduca sexta TaxID=7130 RepID=UPI0018903AD0|nr:uncharacterized protein LOC115442721 [Manduca sexta]XP_037292392.1 uncharacterized protein LOC115442721 [Manduca sexta]